MERIFTYLAAFLSRLVFVLHAFFLIWWLTQVKQDTSYWIFLVILSMLVIETSVTVFLPSRQRILLIFQASTNDESQLSILDQTFVLLLVVGRWMLPKGEITRDQLSSLLLVYIATAADIVELTEIYEDPAVGSNIRLVRAILIVWSLSLLQFSFTIMAVETRAKDRKELKEQLIKQADLREEERTFKVKSYQVAPALYSHKLAHKKAIERQKERLNNLQLKLKSDQKLDEISMENGQMNETNEKPNHKSVIQAFSKALTGFQEFVHRNLNLIQLLTPMLLQDGPFLIVRLLLVSYYKVKGSGTFLFLTAKNALLVTLQVYRICVLCCRPPEDEHDLFQEDEIVRLRNVQTAKKSVQKTNYVIRLVSRLQKKEEKKFTKLD